MLIGTGNWWDKRLTELLRTDFDISKMREFLSEQQSVLNDTVKKGRDFLQRLGSSGQAHLG